MKILLVKRRALGDTVLLSSSIDLFHQRFPGVELSVAVPEAFLPLLEGNPQVKNLWSLEEFPLSLGLKIRREKFDAIFQLHLSPRVRWISWLGGAKKVYTQFQDKAVQLSYGRMPNALEWDRLFLEKVAPGAELKSKPPKIYLSEQELQEGREIWNRLRLDPAKVIFLGLGASRLTKRWSAKHFARFSELIRDRMGFSPAFAVGPGEEEEIFSGNVIDALRVKGFQSAPRREGVDSFGHLAGLSVRDLAKAISAVKAYVGNDSGPKHLAIALGKPTITIFGPEDPKEWHPYSVEQHPYFFLPNLSCRKEDGGRWCGVQYCGEDTVEKHRCMDGIDPLEVYLRLEKLIHEPR
jgi:ADP-heptose:LPS heptosyltransferase